MNEKEKAHHAEQAKKNPNYHDELKRFPMEVWGVTHGKLLNKEQARMLGADFHPEEIKPGWVESAVDENFEHIRMYYQDDEAPSALAAIIEGQITVQLLIDQSDPNEVLKKVKRELDFYFDELDKVDPWAYAIYHCWSTANLYSDVHWYYFPAGYPHQDEP